MPISVRRLSPVFGAEVTGVDLAAGVDDEAFALIHRAFLDHGVLFFKGQSQLEPADQIEFARRLGPLHKHPAAPTDDDEAALFVIHAHRDSPVANGNGWHTDVSCDEQPPMATMLQIHQIPEGGGGDTLFADMEAAYATLPQTERTKLRNLSARHESEHVYRGRYADRNVDDSNTVYPASEHPVVRTHPDTGRPSIYVNRSFTTGLVGMDHAESTQLLKRLFRHVEQPEFQLRFTWDQNDIALWDNRRLQHFAIWDYWPDERRGHRVSILGDRPCFDPNAPEPPIREMRLSGGSLTT